MISGSNPALPSGTNPFIVKDFLTYLSDFLDIRSVLNMQQVNKHAYEYVDDKTLVSILSRCPRKDLAKIAKASLKCAILIFNDEKLWLHLTPQEFIEVCSAHNVIKEVYFQSKSVFDKFFPKLSGFLGSQKTVPSQYFGIFSQETFHKLRKVVKNPNYDSAEEPYSHLVLPPVMAVALSKEIQPKMLRFSHKHKRAQSAISMDVEPVEKRGQKRSFEG